MARYSVGPNYRVRAQSDTPVLSIDFARHALRARRLRATSVCLALVAALGGFTAIALFWARTRIA